MALHDEVRRTDVLKAIAECDARGRDVFLEHYGFGKARRYVLRHKGRSYDSKAILGVAHKFSCGGTLLGSSEFVGGVPVQKILEKLGFTAIVDARQVEP